MRQKGFGLYRMSDTYQRGVGRALFADAVYVREEILQGLAALQDWTNR
jgi:hypothetical protein